MSFPAFAVAPYMRANRVTKCKSLSPNRSTRGTTASTLHAALAHSLGSDNRLRCGFPQRNRLRYASVEIPLAT
ncbi:hypothetical protein RO07_03745 [Pandoraea pulmonicola]|uniref:Uncharacterized protein n=1 Tax=Pandoraea pulmonicola TaxID=93221 RepID=A0ABN4ENP0_PANPU|nr:hypothetical protein RO07_03745 [Pandoraea pulmonicola]